MVQSLSGALCYLYGLMDGAELDGRQASGDSSLCGQVTVDDVNHFQWT
jgi:hypothetical protein